MSTSTSMSILENAAYHGDLLSSIAELDYVPSAQTQQAVYLKDLENELRKSEQQAKELSKTTAILREKHQDLHDSTARRLIHKLSGKGDKFAERESEEERKYLEALEQELMQQDNHDVLSRITSEARELLADLSSKAARYESLKEDLGKLYRVVFDGPTHDFPEDDTLEYAFQSAQSQYDRTQQKLNADSQAAEILARADGVMDACESKMKAALDLSNWDRVGGTLIDIFKHNVLMSARSLAAQAEMLIQHAMSISPDVHDIGELANVIARGSVVTDVILDNPFRDHAFYEKIKASIIALQNAHARLRVEIRSASTRVEACGHHLTVAAQRLESSRTTLYSFRQEVFQRVAGPQSVHAEFPPNYDTAVAAPLRHSTDVLVSISAESTSQQWGSRNPYAAALATRTFVNETRKD